MCCTHRSLTCRETSFQLLYKWIPIFSLFKRLFLKFSTNGYPYIFIQELFFSNFLQIGNHVLFAQSIFVTWLSKGTWHSQFALDVTLVSILIHLSHLSGLTQGKFSIHSSCPHYAWQLKIDLVAIRLVTKTKFNCHNFQLP
jgi:hypothetical protein